MLSSHSSFNDVRPHLDQYQAVIYGQEEICGINDVLSGRSHIPFEAAGPPVSLISEGGQLEWRTYVQSWRGFWSKVLEDG